jgi:hypothetical protein
LIARKPSERSVQISRFACKGRRLPHSSAFFFINEVWLTKEREKMTIKDTKRLIASPKLINELVYHDITKMQREVGPLWKYIDDSMVPESYVTVLVREMERDIPEDSDAGPSPHTHDVNQLYCLLGEMKIEVTPESEKHLVKGPASTLVPADTNHAIRFAGERATWSMF